MRRYRLERNANGRITQCENADGGNIYAQREEINKKAMENLERPTPGKLGGLSNMQVFNFSISAFSTGFASVIYNTYNTTSGFPANAVQTIMFGVAGTNNKALYYNIVDIKAQLNYGGASFVPTQDSYIEFYLLQNSSGTSSLGTKIPQPAPLSGNGGGAVTFSTSGDINGHQSISADIGNSSVSVPSSLKGYRASGLALKTIHILTTTGETSENAVLDISVTVDNSSVSTTY